MSIARLIKSIQNLKGQLNNESGYQKIVSVDKESLPHIKLLDESNLPENLSEEVFSVNNAPTSERKLFVENSLKNHLTKKRYSSNEKFFFKKKQSLPMIENSKSTININIQNKNSFVKQPDKVSKVFIIGIPLVRRGEDNKAFSYSQLNIDEKIQLILKTISHCILNIKQMHHLTEQDTVIIQLRELAFPSKAGYVTIEERNKILLRLSSVFPTPFNLIISTGGIGYITPLPKNQPNYSNNKIQHIIKNYENIENQYPKFKKEGSLIQDEKKVMKRNLQRAQYVFHNKNYILTNNYHVTIKNPKNALVFPKIVPFDEIKCLQDAGELMIYNPSKKKNYVALDNKISIHNLICAEINFSKLIRPPYDDSCPSLLLINSATRPMSSEIVKKIKKWHHYFFQVDSVKGCQYGIFKKDNSIDINFYEYNIYHDNLKKAPESPHIL